MNFDIKTEQLGDDAYVISLAGEVDLYTAPEFKQQLLEVIGQGGKQVVGVVEVCALAHPDPKDDTGVWKCVDVRAVCDVPKPVSLAAAKANPKLSNMALVRTSRLSVQPVRADEWKEVCRMGGLDPRKITP